MKPSVDRPFIRQARRVRVLFALVFLFGASLLIRPLTFPAQATARPEVPAGLSAADWQALQAKLPPGQQAYLKASNTNPNDDFGWSVAVDGDTVVVGAYGEDSSTTGVNSTPNEAMSWSGAAYVFVRSGADWAQQAYLKASNTGADDYFGWGVALDGDTLVVTAINEDSAATGVGGNQNDNSASGAGAAYVFVRTGTAWTQQAYLKASNPGAFDAFGYSVSLDKDTIVIGAYQEASAATGVDGDQSDNSIGGAGAAYVFARSGTAWAQQAYLKSPNTMPNQVFGIAVAVAGDTVVVGASQEGSSTTGVNSTPNGQAANSGAAYVFVRVGSAWAQQAYLKASNTDSGDQFGRSVAIDGNTIVIGAPAEYSAATGVNGNQNDNSASGAGAAYVFVRTGSAWAQQAYLKASNSGVGDMFGYSVAVAGNAIVVGAPQESSAATGVDGNGSDNTMMLAGAAYTFARSGTIWTHQAYIKASNTGWNDDFGWSVDVDADTAVIGAMWEDSAATGVNGDQDSNGAPDAGAVYAMTGVAGPPAATSARYLPLLMSERPWLVEINAQAIPTRPVTAVGETYYSTTITLPEPLPAGGHFYFSSAPDMVTPIKVDDELVVTVNGQERLAVFATYPLVAEVPRAEIEQWLGQNVVVSFRDKFGSVVGSAPVWLIWAP
ncbi:MAG TPA: FG-GAP repeat protein [Herpetosiphonaceae bacterium]|nr:FG-GAP repeat protein [Herpetosiphonaceae bacterium]